MYGLESNLGQSAANFDAEKDKEIAQTIKSSSSIQISSYMYTCLSVPLNEHWDKPRRDFAIGSYYTL